MLSGSTILPQKKWHARHERKCLTRSQDFERIKNIVAQHSAMKEELCTRILRSSAPEIVSGIATRQWTSTEVLVVYIRRVIELEDLGLNAITEFMIVEALERAKTLDETFTHTGRLVGRLHGVPISVKDLFFIKGYDSTIGITHLIDKPANKTDPLIQLLIDDGAIPFVKTNVPQTMFSFECANPLFGTSINPYAPDRTPGGSSGGEAALIASDSSPLGVGSDSGGSLRIPAGYSGCYSLKPTPGRFPLTSGTTTNPNPGFEVVRTSSGPMGRSVSDVELMMKVVGEKTKSSARLSRVSNVVPIGWNKVEVPKRLKFGYIMDDGLCRASPANRRAIMETVEALRKQGHQVVEVHFPEVWKAVLYPLATATEGHYDGLLGAIGDDPQEEAMFLASVPFKLPSFVRSLIGKYMKYGMHDSKASKILKASGGSNVKSNQKLLRERPGFIQSVRDKLWGELELDGLLAPCLATPALAHGDTKYLAALCSFTALFNVVETAVGVVPVTFVDKDKDAIPEGFLANVGDKGSSILENRVYGKDGAYNAEKMHGLPVGIQIVGAHYEDERVVEMMKIVDSALGRNRGFGPGEYVRGGHQRRLSRDTDLIRSQEERMSIDSGYQSMRTPTPLPGRRQSVRLKKKQP